MKILYKNTNFTEHIQATCSITSPFLFHCPSLSLLAGNLLCKGVELKTTQQEVDLTKLNKKLKFIK